MSINKKHGLGRGLEALLGDDDFSFNLDNINTGDNNDNGVKLVSIKIVFKPNSFAGNISQL